MNPPRRDGVTRISASCEGRVSAPNYLFIADDCFQGAPSAIYEPALQCYCRRPLEQPSRVCDHCGILPSHLWLPSFQSVNAEQNLWREDHSSSMPARFEKIPGTPSGCGGPVGLLRQRSSLPPLRGSSPSGAHRYRGAEVRLSPLLPRACRRRGAAGPWKGYAREPCS